MLINHSLILYEQTFSWNQDFKDSRGEATENDTPKASLTKFNLNWEDTACLLSAQHCAKHLGYEDKSQDASQSSRSSQCVYVSGGRAGLSTCCFLHQVVNPHSSLTSHLKHHSLRVFFPEPPVMPSHSILCNCHWL